VTFPVIDGLSSASILRVSNDTFGYIGKIASNGGFRLNTVDVNTRNLQLTGSALGGNVAIQTAANGKIALIIAEEIGYETFIGESLKVYDAATLMELKSFDFSPAAGKDAEPLHHRDAGFSLGDKYLAVATEVDAINVGGTTVQQFVSIYDVVGSATPVHVPVFSTPTAGATSATPSPDLSGIGTLIFVSTWGDYLIAGGSAGGTAVFQIKNEGGALSLTKIGIADGIAAHWAISNGKYVLESKAGTAPGKVKVWKWNGASAPTAVGIANTGDSGSVRGYSFDEADNTAYAFGVGNKVGTVCKINLTNASTQELFTITTWNIAGRTGATRHTLGTVWNLEHRNDGTDNYYVLSGAVSSKQETLDGSGSVTGTPTTNSLNGVLVLKNPTSTTATNGTAVVSAVTDSSYTTAVRTMKTFKSAGGDIFYAAKNYTGNPAWGATPYVLQLRKIN
jgi:hypothetical protein